jgi:pimeloyl-ACP methyl ester carboxylesterase
MSGIKRHFIEAAGRRVHYRTAGSGPPVVMLHGSPGDGQMLEHEIITASAAFSVIALDTPGFGFSDPLPGETLTVRDLAAATAEAMQALGLPPCRVFGTHTGAAIAIELGLGWPHLVTGLLMEGLPAFTQAEIDTLFQGYFAPMVPDPLGGHLTSTWIRFRDQFTWFPWPSRDVTRLNPFDRPTPAEIDVWVSMFYRGSRTYRPAYRAACTYGQAAIAAAAALRVPAIYTATVEDMLHPHLDRLPDLQPNQRIAQLPSPIAEKCPALTAYLQSLPGGDAPPPPPTSRPVGADPAMLFIESGANQVLVRCYGSPARPALLVAHDAPGTGLACETLARSLAAEFYVCVPDLPGTGHSTLAAGERALQEGATALSAVADHAGLRHFAVLGLGCGAAVAAVLAGRDDQRLSALLLDAPPAPNAATAEAIAPDLTLSPEGAHWLRAWLSVRDGQIYDPWFAGTRQTQRRTQGNFDAQWLHDQTCALMSGRDTAHLLPREAWLFDIKAALRHATVPVHILPQGDRAALVTARLQPEQTAA